MDLTYKLISQYPNSEQVNSGLVFQCRIALPLARRDLIDNAKQRPGERGASLETIQQAQFYKAEFFDKVRGERNGAMMEYRRTFQDYPPNNDFALMAEIRYTDYMPDANAHECLTTYNRILERGSQLTEPYRQYLLMRKALTQFQLDDIPGARETFQHLTADTITTEIRFLAQKHLHAFQTPESVEWADVVYDRGIRFRDTRLAFDAAYWDMQRLIVLSQKPFFRKFMDDPNISSDRKAALSYRLAYAYYDCGYGQKSIQTAQDTLHKFNPRGRTHYECQYLIAWLTRRSENNLEAARLFQEFIDSSPPDDMAQNAYVELSKALHLSGNLVEAMLVLDELIARYPAAYLSDMSKDFLNNVLMQQDDSATAEYKANRALASNAAGNRTRVDAYDGSTTTTTDYTYNAHNQLTTDTLNNYAYDLHGAMTTRGTNMTYTHDRDGKLTQAVGPNGTVSYVNSPLHNRLMRTAPNGTKLRYYYDGLSIVLVKEKPVGGAWRTKYTYALRQTSAGQIIAEREATAWDGSNQPTAWTDRFYHTDPLGNVMQITDANGDILASYEQDAYGNVIAGSQAAFHQTTKDYDPDTEAY